MAIGFFQYFDDTIYDNDRMVQNAVNLVTSVQPGDINISNFYIFQKYAVASGETPESVSHKLYGVVDHFWTILVINNIVNPYLDWPLSDQQVELYATKLYGASNLYDAHHYYWTGTDGTHKAGLWLDEVDAAAAAAGTLVGSGNYWMAVTNLAYEIETNGAKKGIMVINPTMITAFVEAYSSALAGK